VTVYGVLSIGATGFALPESWAKLDEEEPGTRSKRESMPNPVP
jgi:hypothetical protein